MSIGRARQDGGPAGLCLGQAVRRVRAATL